MKLKIRSFNDEGNLKFKKFVIEKKKEFKVKNFKCFLSISDEKEYSTAFTIIQSK